MNNMALTLVSGIFIGIGATLTFDLWALFLKNVFKIAPSNFCLVGRWLLSMPDGIFKHSNIVSSPRKSAECAVGWIAHYMTGITFAIAFVALAGSNWLRHPTLIPAVVFGIVTVIAKFFHHAAFVRAWICGIKDAKSCAGKTSQLDEPCCVRRRSLSICIVG
jgi:hypothetical protein